MKKQKRIIVAMSGGVDSSVAALILKNQDYEVIGVTMRLWSLDRDNVPKSNKRCCSVEDTDDAKSVCQILGIKHYVMNFEEPFQEHVVNYFVKEYESVRTPHPCLACNDKIKFDFLLRKALFLEADYIATGHYAKIKSNNGIYELHRGKDNNKDQSYVLFNLSQKELSKLLLPVGEYTKNEIRDLALEYKLPVANKPDSQDICFIPNGNYREFVENRIKKNPGKTINTAGENIGEHPGVHFFTIGQRRKLGLKDNFNEALYVTKIDADKNEITLGSESELYKTRLYASKINFISGIIPDNSIKVNVKIRYKSQMSPATLSANLNNAIIDFDEPQRAITPGQPAVFYQNDKVVGGGIIETVPENLELKNENILVHKS